MDFNKLLRAFLKELRRDTKEKFDRVLPFGEYISDRWEKAKFLKFGKNSSIYDSSLVYGNVQVGDNVWIGPFTILDGSGGLLTIGDNCQISAGVQIYTHDTVERVIQDGDITRAPVKIGNRCYIGPNSIIAKGVTIGDNVVIGANSFVNKAIAPNSKGFGTPFQVTGQSV
jgi:acetyltransferase-like isoleucine patch superfamily enzyme